MLSKTGLPPNLISIVMATRLIINNTLTLRSLAELITMSVSSTWAWWAILALVRKFRSEGRE